MPDAPDDDCCEHIDLCPHSSDVSCREQARRRAVPESTPTEPQTPENDAPRAMAGLSQKASLPDPREDTTVPDVARLFSGETTDDDREMKAFVAGWFAHARNPERLVVEDAWRAYRTRPIPPGAGGSSDAPAQALGEPHGGPAAAVDGDGPELAADGDAAT